MQNLGSYVVGRPHHFRKFAGRIERSSRSEIPYLQSIVLLIDQNVLGLQISVHNPLFVHVVDRRQNLLDNLGSFSLTEKSTLLDVVEQVTSVAQLEDKNVLPSVLEHLEQLD